MDEKIKSNLALQVAQLSLDKATLQAQLELSQARVNELESLLDTQNKPAEEKGE